LSGEDALISNPPWEYTLFSGELEVCLRDTGLRDFRSRDHPKPKDFRDTLVSRRLHHHGVEKFLVYFLVESSRKFAEQLASPREYALLGSVSAREISRLAPS
jgi:hypothetical protein